MSDPRFDPLNTSPILTAEIDDLEANSDRLTSPDFYTRDFSALTSSRDPFADNESFREAQMWTDFSKTASPEELASLKSDPLLQDPNLAFVDSAANTDYILSLMNRGDKAMDRHLEDSVYGEGKNMNPKHNHSLKKILNLYRRLSEKSANDNSRTTPNSYDKEFAKALIGKYASQLSGMGHGLPTEILGGDYGPEGIGAAPRKKSSMNLASRNLASLKARRDAGLKARAQKIALLKAAQAKKKAADDKKRSDNKAKSSQAKKSRLDLMAQKREAARKRKAASLLRMQASKKRKLASSKARPGKPSGSPMTVRPRKGMFRSSVLMKRPGQEDGPLVTDRSPGSDSADEMTPEEAPGAEPMGTLAEAMQASAEPMSAEVSEPEPGEQPAPEAEPEAVAPEMQLTEDEAEAASADADATEAQAEAQDADADADETEASDDEVEPSDLAGDFVGAVSEEKSKILRAAAQKNPTGAKIRAGMTVYRKARSGDPRAQMALSHMAKKAESGDKQAKRDLLAIKVGKLAQEQLVTAKRAYAGIKKAAARSRGFALVSLLKSSRQKAMERFKNACVVQKKAGQGDEKAIAFINTINKAAQAGDEGGVRAQKNLALAALVEAHSDTSQGASLERDAELVRDSRSRFLGSDARRQLATIAAAASKGDKPSQHRMKHFALASMIFDMYDGKDYKVTPSRILKAGGRLPAVPTSVKAAAATVLAARKGNQAARNKLQATARAALSGNSYAMRMMGDVALVGAMVAKKKGRALHPRIKEAAKIVAKAKQGDPGAKRTIIRASRAAKAGDKQAVAAMVALTAANTAYKAGGIPVQMAAPGEQPHGDLLPLDFFPNPVQAVASSIRKFFSFYREGVISRSNPSR